MSFRLSDSPYQSPKTIETQSEPTVVETIGETPSLLPLAQLGLRLLGVMFFGDGLAIMFGGLVFGVLQAKAYTDAGYDVPVDPQSGGWIAQGVPYMALGLYLMLGGNWILQSVFAPSRQRQETELAAEDDRDAPVQD